MGGIIAAGFGAMVALPALRVQGHYLAIATLGFALFVQQTLFEWELAYRRRAGPVRPATLPDRRRTANDFDYYYLLLAFFLLMAWVTGNFAKSLTGRSLMAFK